MLGKELNSYELALFLKEMHKGITWEKAADNCTLPHHRVRRSLDDINVRGLALDNNMVGRAQKMLIKERRRKCQQSY